MARKRKRKSNPHTVGNYRPVKMVDITEDDLEYVGELYRSKQGVYYFMVPVNRIRTTEIKASEYGDLERMVEALVAKQFEAYRKENEERWKEYFGTQNLTSIQKDPQNSAKENQPLIYKIVDERVEKKMEPLKKELAEIKNALFEIRDSIKDLSSKKSSQSPVQPQPATALGENVGTLTPPDLELGKYLDELRKTPKTSSVQPPSPTESKPPEERKDKKRKWEEDVIRFFFTP